MILEHTQSRWKGFLAEHCLEDVRCDELDYWLIEEIVFKMANVL